MADKKSLSIKLGGRVYPLKVDEVEEKSILAIVDELNEKIESFGKMYVKNDKQDYLSMLLLTYAVDLNNLKENKVDNKEISNDWEKSLVDLEKQVQSLL